METGILIVLVIVYTYLMYLLFTEDRLDKKNSGYYYTTKMATSTRDSAITGLLYGLTTSTPHTCIQNGILWGCIGGIKSFITRHL